MDFSWHAQGDEHLQNIAGELLPSLAESSIALIQGEDFAAAAKHAEALKSLASTWEALSKILGNQQVKVLSADQLEPLVKACEAAQSVAATPKVSLCGLCFWICHLAFYWLSSSGQKETATLLGHLFANPATLGLRVDRSSSLLHILPHFLNLSRR